MQTAGNRSNFDAMITEAVGTPDAILSNFKITRLHCLLSTALSGVLRPDAGANFHSWAVWGSRKAGVTIRQEDKDQASRDATIVAGIVGTLVGVAAGWLCARLMGWSLPLSIAGWALIGALVGGCCGYWLAGYTRREASRLILEGNRTVLDDIGRVTARYLDYVGIATEQNRDTLFREFLDQFREGPTEHGGQDLLKVAFEQYETARRSNDPKVRHECCYFANCLAVYHEHIRLQPYISRSLPFLIRRCVTERMKTYSVGEKTLSVHDDVPPLNQSTFPTSLATIESAVINDFLQGPEGLDTGRGTLANTRAKDWTKIRERMGYIVNLFRTRHLEPGVMALPYSAEQLEAIAIGTLPARPW